MKFGVRSLLRALIEDHLAGLQPDEAGEEFPRELDVVEAHHQRHPLFPRKDRTVFASLSARVKVGGLYAQAEVLRRQRTDNLSSRPIIATGGYAQGSYYVPVKANVLGLSPIARAGLTVEDQSFEPRTSILTEAGAAIYWHRGSTANDTIKLIVQYFGEQRITEGEDAYGLTTQMQLQF